MVQAYEVYVQGAGFAMLACLSVMTFSLTPGDVSPYSKKENIALLTYLLCSYLPA